MKSLSIFIIIFSSLFFIQLASYAGGITIVEGSVTFNGYPCGTRFPPSARISMKYMAEHYSFSGGRRRYEYLVFKLTNLATSKIHYALQKARRYEPYGTSSDAVRQAASLELVFILPPDIGTYRIDYFPFPMFTDYAVGVVGYDSSIMTDRYLNNQISSFIRTEGSGNFRTICRIIAGHDADPVDNIPEVYLKINNEVPGFKKNLSFKDTIAKFSWITKNLDRPANALFRYRLYPEDDWSAWQKEQSVNYYFINKGVHEFQVECQYSDHNIIKTTKQTRYSFVLDNSLIATPEKLEIYPAGAAKMQFIDKAGVQKTSTDAAEVIGSVYNKSSILILGAETYDDPSFVKLPWISKDLDAVASQFNKMGFTVIQPKASTSRQMMDAIRSALAKVERNDRLIIYISSHGFSDPITGRPMIATKDCVKSSGTNAIEVDDIKNLIRGVDDKARHVLLILDCCTAGVGVIDKSASLGALKSMVTARGAHILTAGMANQNAKMDNDLQMSIFTYYLIQGLRTYQADYTKDGIITLSELLIYVQYQVGNRTKSEQVPAYGRISGYGEIIFN